jgi:hypothetical protein
MSDERQKEYAQLLTMPAFMDLARWAAEESDRSMRMMDAVSAKDLCLNHVSEERGFRKGMAKVIQYAKGVAEGR